MSARTTFFASSAAILAVALLSSCYMPPRAYDQPPQGYATVPHLVGMSLEQAQNAIAQNSLALGAVDYQASRYQQGMVIGQNPARRSRVATGTAVNLTVSSGAGEPAPETVAVPNVVGLDYDSAVSTLAQAGLSIGNVAYRPGPGFADGVVIAQSPSRGQQVYPGSAVDLAVARGRQENLVSVPNVVGMHHDSAAQALARYGLAMSVDYSAQSRHRPDYVISQNPPAGSRVHTGSAVTITIARPHEVRVSIVPNLIGLTQDSAQAALSEAGLSMGRVAHSDGPPYGIIKAQEPASGSRVAPGSAVDIVVGHKPKPVLISVPSLSGMGVDEARAVLHRTGLALGRVSRTETSDPSIQEGQIVAQDPEAGRYVTKGTEVGVTVARKVVPTVLVPGVAGMPLHEASGRIAAAGLSTGSVTYQESPQPGIVISQSPAAESRVYRGTAVNLVVGKRSDPPPPDPDIVVVPSVILKSESEARQVIEAAGLRVGHIKHGPGLPRKRVMVQVPSPGMRVKRGSEVNLHISH